MDNSKNSEKFIKGAAILAFSGLMVKVLGVFFRIPLNNWLGPDGMAYYSGAYAVYGALLVLSTAGIPVVISRLVSEHIAVREYRYAHRVFQASLILMASVGFVLFVICFFGADAIADFTKNPKSASALKAVSPALFLVPVLSSFRGYFNGRQNMNPTGLSEMSEQLVRVIAGLVLAKLLFDRYGKPEGAAGASFGASAGALAGLTVIFGIYLLNRRVIYSKIRRGSQYVEPFGKIIKTIVIIAIPIIIGSEIMPIMNLLDLGMIMRILQRTGWSQAESEYLYGLISSFCSSLIAFPQIITQAVSVSLVPAVTSRFRLKDYEGLHETVSLGYRTTMIMAFPCAVGLAVLAEPILKLLYVSQWEACADAAPTLMIMSVGIVFLSVMQTSTSILQAVNRQMLPVRNLLIGCIGKVICTLVLTGIRTININGAAIGTMSAYIVAMILNMYDVKKYTGTEIDPGKIFIRPFAASAVMGAGAYGIYFVITHMLSGHSAVLVNAAGVIISILFAIVIYVILIFALHAVTPEEVSRMPMLNKFAGFFEKRKSSK